MLEMYPVCACSADLFVLDFIPVYLQHRKNALVMQIGVEIVWDYIIQE